MAQLLKGLRRFILGILCSLIICAGFAIYLTSDGQGGHIKKGSTKSTGTEPLDWQKKDPKVLPDRTAGVDDDVIKMTEENLLDSGNHTAIFLRRRSHVKEVCKDPRFSHHKTGTSFDSVCKRFVVNKRLDVSWCKVPKVASTYWKKAFYILSPKKGPQIHTKMSDLAFGMIHTTPLINICKNREMTENLLAGNQKSFFMSRDPYSRLFSAYIDKLFLSDHWASVGVYIIKHFRKIHKEKLRALCGYDVTFPEFINYVIHFGKTGEGVVDYHDRHWEPISKICHPCEIDFKYIIKLETFTRDREFIFEQLGINRVIRGVTLIEDPLVTMSQRIDAFWSRALICVSRDVFMKRLWTAFQNLGYLPDYETLDDNLPRKQIFKAEDFTQVVANVYNKYKSVDLHGQKHKALVKAYSQLTFNQMKSIQNMYYEDFKLFDYDIEPNYLYARFDQNIDPKKKYIIADVCSYWV